MFDLALVVGQLAVGDDLNIALAGTVVQLQKREARLCCRAGCESSLATAPAVPIGFGFRASATLIVCIHSSVIQFSAVASARFASINEFRSTASHRSASSAAMQPVPAEVMAWR